MQSFYEKHGTTCKIQNGRQGGHKMADGVWKGVQSRRRKWKMENGMEWKMENNGEYSGPLTLLPVDRLNGDRLQRRR